MICMICIAGNGKIKKGGKQVKLEIAKGISVINWSLTSIGLFLVGYGVGLASFAPTGMWGLIIAIIGAVLFGIGAFRIDRTRKTKPDKE